MVARNTFVLVAFLNVFTIKSVVLQHVNPFINDINILSEYEDGEDLSVADTSDLLEAYDFIIVGAGSAGSVIASRLSEAPEVSVLLLEAGTDGDFITDVPFMAPSLILSKYNWNYKTEPTPGACLGYPNGFCDWPRGKALGGTSVINYMQYTRGNKRDFEAWAELGNYGWSYNESLPYFLKSEDMTIPDLQNSVYHNSGGDLTVESIAYKTPIDRSFLEAGVELGYDVNDFNGEKQTGFYLSQINTRNGRRCSAAKAFLRPAQHRSNLHISKDSFVTRIQIDPTTKVVQGVHFVKNDLLYFIKACKEVILSAGSIASPQLLMLSGIGPQDHLEDLNIPVIQDLKVGFNLQDHIGFGGLSFTVNDVVMTSDYMSRHNIEDFLANGRGPLTAPAALVGMAFIQTNDNQLEDLPDVEVIILGSLFNENEISINVALLHPRSAGRLMLRSANVYEYPRIHPNYLEDPYDLYTLREGVKLALRLTETNAFKKLNTTLNKTSIKACDHLEFGSDEYWECGIRQFTNSLHHQVGTCKMGPASDKDAVVDPELLVYGVHGLRIVDASIMPVVPGAHTNAATYMIAEKAADMVKRKWLVV